MSILTIAGRELRSLFLSPLAWTLLAVLQAILSYALLIQMERFAEWQSRILNIPGAPGITELIVTPMLRTGACVLRIVIPFLTMRCVSEERRQGTLALLLCAPISMGEIILGKYLGLLAYLACILALIGALALMLLAGGTLDFGRLAAGMLGLALLGASVAAAGLFFSTLTSQPVIAAISTFGLVLGLWILDWTAGQTRGTGRLLEHLGLTRHLDALLRGLIDTYDIAYFLLIIASFLVLSTRRLASIRRPY